MVSCENRGAPHPVRKQSAEWVSTRSLVSLCLMAPMVITITLWSESLCSCLPICACMHRDKSENVFCMCKHSDCVLPEMFLFVLFLVPVTGTRAMQPPMSAAGTWAYRQMDARVPAASIGALWFWVPAAERISCGHGHVLSAFSYHFHSVTLQASDGCYFYVRLLYVNYGNVRGVLCSL